METVTVKNIKGYFSKYNQQECRVIKHFPSGEFGMNLRVIALDGVEFSVGKNQYECSPEQLKKYNNLSPSRTSNRPSALRRILRNSARSTT